MTDLNLSSNKKDVAAVWPDGWYLYENGKLNGPLSADHAFSLTPESEDGSPRLVSRKGFTQWYPLQDFATLYRLSETMAQKVSAASVSASEHKSKPAVKTKQVGPTTILAKSIPPQSSNSALRRAVADAAASSVAPQSPVPRAISKVAVEQEYYLARSRLALGQLRNPWALAGGSWLLSFGLYWSVWFVSVYKEIERHTQNAVPAPKWLKLTAFASMLPLLNVWPTYRLACQIREMERQNKYTYMNPQLVLLASLLPPIAMFYLQSGLNRHWTLHAKHLILKRRADADAAASGGA